LAAVPLIAKMLPLKILQQISVGAQHQRSVAGEDLLLTLQV
jgi:hypothetical protein